ncbi:hypothetical protein BpHYR1_018315, partial [Brachionus plicatilis]
MLTELQTNISSLNLLICGSNSKNCSDRCGAIGCSTCGIECDSFVSSYSKYKNLEKKVNQTFDKKGSQLKKILTKLNSDRLGYKNFNDDLEFLKISLGNDLNQYRDKKMFVKNLINDMFNLSDRYQSNMEKIDDFTRHVTQFGGFESEKEFYFMLESIVEKELSLKKKYKLDEIDQDLHRHKKFDFIKLNNTDKITKLMNNLKNQLNETELRINEAEPRVNTLKNSFNFIERMQSQVNKTLESLKLKLSSIRINGITGQEGFFLKNINVTDVKKNVGFGNENLVLVRKKIEAIHRIFKNLMEQLKLSTSDEIIMHLIKLMDGLMRKNGEMVIKYEKIEKLKILNQELEARINRDKSNISLLKYNINSIRNRFAVDKF